MRSFKDHIDQLISKLDADEETKRDVYDEMLDHLESSKRAYMNVGYSEKEAERRAVDDFGSSKTIGRQLNQSLRPFGGWIRTAGWMALSTYIIAALIRLLIGPGLGLVFYQNGEWTTKRIDRYQYLPTSESFNLMPLRTLSRYWLHHQQFNFDIWFTNTFGNALAWIPLGILLPIVVRSCRRPGLALMLSFSLALFCEVVQWIAHSGVADVDSILLRTAGSMLGYGVYTITRRFIKSTWSGRRAT